MLTAHRVRTSLVLGAAGATVIAALLLGARPRVETSALVASADDGMRLTAELTTGRILAGAHDHNLAIAITAPTGQGHARPPLSVAIVIDRSGSMNGEPMENAKEAASRLVGQLDAADAFTVVSYSTGDEVVMPMSRATDANKTAARAAISRIYDDGGTCLSCGLIRGASELAQTPVSDGLRRIVLISDGQANAGIYDRGELAQLAATTAANGVSISAVGVGLDFDEVTMQRIAEVGRGNYYFVEDTANLSAMFQRELGGLTETVASDAHLVISEPAGVRIEEAYGYPMTREGRSVVIPVADLRAGESRKVVLRVTVAQSTLGSFDVSTVRLGWRRVDDGRSRTATAIVRAEVVEDARAVAASVVPAASQAAEEAMSARALEEATTVYESQGYEAAKQVLDHRMQGVRANSHVGTGSLQKIQSANDDAIESFRAAAPAKASKVGRVKAYELAH
ncbi:MAG: Von Willebrand factor type domain protein [Myxococcales bacterium]|nr:Von Willebrand factor type domain protein [Myxococcales bacterium]